MARVLTLIKEIFAVYIDVYEIDHSDDNPFDITFRRYSIVEHTLSLVRNKIVI